MKILRIVLYLALGLLLLAAAAVAIFAMTFDPNRYKDDIQRIVKERTGRTLELKGPLELAFWPSLGARVSGVVLSERAAAQPFVSLDSAHASVALLPLLRGQATIDRVRLAGLKAQIIKGKDGRFNFQDLIESPEEKPKAEKKAPSGGAPVACSTRLAARNGNRASAARALSAPRGSSPEACGATAGPAGPKSKS